jgi:hypothetical protein
LPRFTPGQSFFLSFFGVLCDNVYNYHCNSVCIRSEDAGRLGRLCHFDRREKSPVPGAMRFHPAVEMTDKNDAGRFEAAQPRTLMAFFLPRQGGSMIGKKKDAHEKEYVGRTEQDR